MGTMTFTEKGWADARPASVKDTGVAAAIRAVVKALPGGKTDGLKTPEVCADALEHLAALLLALGKAQTLLAAVKPDGEDATAKVKKWIGEVKTLRDEAIGRKGNWSCSPATRWRRRPWTNGKARPGSSTRRWRRSSTGSGSATRTRARPKASSRKRRSR